MARAAVLIAVLGVAGAALAAGACDEERARTGLALASGPAALRIAVLDDGGPAAAGGFRAGDVIVQVNGTLPRSCADWARAVRDARRDHKALLVLARRGDVDVPLALGAATWERVVAALPPPPPAEPPSVRELVASVPPVLAPPARLTLDELLREVAALTPATPAHLDLYQHALARTHERVGALSAGGGVPPTVVAGLTTVLRYHDAAAMAWAAAEAENERERRPRRLPSSDAAGAPFFSGDAVAAAVDEFPFLRATVVRDPAPGLLAGESAGMWRPGAARTLLWQRAREETDHLAAWLHHGTP